MLSRLTAVQWLGAAALAAGSSMANAQAGTPAPAASAPAPTPAPAPAPAPAVSGAQVSVLELGAATTAPALQASGQKFLQLLTLTYDPAKGTGPLRLESAPLNCEGEAIQTLLFRGDKAVPGTTPTNVVTIDKPVSPEWVLLTAALTRIATCTGQLRFTIGTQATQAMPFRVTRAAAVEAPLEVGGAQRFLREFRQDTVTFSMRGLPERELKVTPALFELGLKGGLNSALEGWSMDPPVVTVPPGGSSEFKLLLKNLPPGEYAGKLELASDGYKAKTHPFSVTVRYGWWWAALLVAIGAAGALWLKSLATRVRPKLVVRVATTKLLSQLDVILQTYVLDDVEAGVLSAIKARIGAFDDEASQPGDPDAAWPAKAQTELTDEGVKLTAFPDWLNARRKLASITNLDAAMLAGFETRLKDARNTLASSAALDPLAVASLANLAGDIEDAKDKAAKEAANAAVYEAAKAEGTATSSDAKSDFQEAQTQATQASTLLAAKNYPGFRAAFDASGRAYYSGMAQELQARLPVVPAGGGANLAAVHFAPIAPEVRVHLEQATRAPDLRAARTSYASALKALRPVHATAVLQNMPGVPPLPEGSFPDEAVRAQQPLMPRMATTVREDVSGLTAQIVSLDKLVDWVAVGVAAAMGVLLVWSPTPGWGQPTDLFAALLWGMGLHTVGSSTFMGILGLRTKLA